MLKFKRLFGRFPALCAGCLVVVLLLSPFNVYAQGMSFTNSDYPIDVSTLPDTSEQYILAKQQNLNIFLFYKPSNQSYCFIACEDFMNDTNVSMSYQFILGWSNTRFITYSDYYVENMNSAHVRLGKSNATTFCKYTGGIYGDNWVDVNLSSSGGVKYYDISDMYLIAFDMKSKVIDNSTQDEMLMYYCVEPANLTVNYVHTLLNPATQKYYFNSNGQLSTGTGNSEPVQPEYITNSIRN